MKFYFFLFFYLLLCSSYLHAQEQSNNESESLVEVKTVEKKEKRVSEQGRMVRLFELAKIIEEEEKSLADLKKRADKDASDADLIKLIQRKTENLNVVKKSFEQIAVKGISLEVFEEEEVPETWQEELTLVVKPLLENLRGLTEKPRRRETLKQTITDEKSAAETAQLALESIQASIDEGTDDKLVSDYLLKVRDKWQRLLNEAERKQELASIELASLDGEEADLLTSFKESIQQFAKQRGLTLLIAFVVAVLIVLFFRALARVIDLRRKKKTSPNRTTYRVIAYAQRLLTMLFVVLGVLIVFFIRGDVLLLAIMFILIFATALGLKNFIPQFIEESRILLNIGRVREQELVVVNGVPWRVASINVFSKLINPEIKGVLRLPLADLKGLVSRKIGDEKWFPSSIGDWVLAEDERLYEVVSQGPDAIELQSAQGTNKLVPSGDYYAAGYTNLTKSKEIRITSTFGVDYSLQNICLDVVPTKFQNTVEAYIKEADLGVSEIRTRVEFKEAGASSLDYLVIVNVNSEASCHYYRIKRYIQQACVKACNEEKWTIPFPQLTISKADD